MKQTSHNIKWTSTHIFFLTVTTMVLFLGFYRNQWDAARPKKFSNVDKTSEALIIGRLVQSRQDGIFSKAAFLGMGDTDPSDINETDSDYQYDTYFNEGTFSTYFLYRSQNAFQAVVFSLIDSISPYSPRLNLRLFRGLTSLLSAIAIGSFLTWSYHEFGLFSALIAFVTTVLSQWLTVFGRNIFWGIWVYFLPLLAVTFTLQQQRPEGSINNFRLAGVIFSTLFLKCLFSGYDFITTAAISACIPIIYFATYERWDVLRLLRQMLVAVASTASAILLSLAILAAQVGSIDGNYNAGIQYIENSLARRTYGDPSQYPMLAASLDAKVTDVLLAYLTTDEVFRRLPLHFLDVTLIFLFFSILFFVLTLWKKITVDQKNKGYALIAATWLAFLSSISTFIVFKSASYIHTHLYFIVWHLPFTILGFALCGYTIKVLYQTLFAPTAPQ